MSSHLFITPDGRPMGRWQEAFPQARFAASVQLASSTSADLLWCCGLRLSTLRGLARDHPDRRLVVLSLQPDSKEALAAFELGARAYCHALATTQMLREVGIVVQHGGLWIGPDLMQRAALAVQQFQGPSPNPDESCLALLTSREQAVARCIANGDANKEIARHLGITERTVKAHLAAIFQKLEVRDRLQLALRVGRDPQSREQVA